MRLPLALTALALAIVSMGLANGTHVSRAEPAFGLMVTVGAEYYLTDHGLTADDCRALAARTARALAPSCIPQ